MATTMTRDRYRLHCDANLQNRLSMGVESVYQNLASAANDTKQDKHCINSNQQPTCTEIPCIHRLCTGMDSCSEFVEGKLTCQLTNFVTDNQLAKSKKKVPSFSNTARHLAPIPTAEIIPFLFLIVMLVRMCEVYQKGTVSIAVEAGK